MSKQRKCPRCGEILEPEDLECPYCGCTDIPEVEIDFDEQYAEDNTVDFNTVVGEVSNDDLVASDLGWTFATDDDLADEEPFEDEDAQKAQKDNKKTAKKLAPLIAEIKNDGPSKESAILEVHNAIYKHMLAIATNRMDKDKTWAEDVYNETFNHLMKDDVIKTLKNDEKFEGWFAIALMNRCRNAWRRKGKIQKYETFESSLKSDEMNFFENIPANVLDDPAVQFEKKEVIEGLTALLDELPYIQSACVKMTCLTGHTCKVTAAALGIPEGTVKTNVSKTKKYVYNRIVELRKENKSFYAIAPIPFLIWMLKEEMEHIEGTQMIVKACELVPVIQEGTQVVSTTAEAASTVTTSTSIENTIVEGATKVSEEAASESVGESMVAEATNGTAATASSGATKASAGLLSKVTVTRGVIGIVCCAVVGVGVATAVNSSQKNNETTEKTAEKSESKDSDKDKTTIKKKKDNQAVFDETLALYQDKINAGTGGDYDVSYDSGISPMISLIESSGGGNGMNLGYAYHDIDGDGQSELLIGDASEEKSSTIYDIWINTDDGPQILKDTTTAINEGQEGETFTRLYNRSSTYITKDGSILHTVFEEGDSIISIGTLADSKYTIDEKMGSLLNSDGQNIYKKLNTKTKNVEETTVKGYNNLHSRYFGDNGVKNVKEFAFKLFEEGADTTVTESQSSESSTPVADMPSDTQTVLLASPNVKITLPKKFSPKSGTIEEACKQDLFLLYYDTKNTVFDGLEQVSISLSEYGNSGGSFKTKTEAEASPESYCTSEFYGSDNQYVVLTYDYDSTSGASPFVPATILIKNINNTETYGFGLDFMMYGSGNSTPSQEQYQALYSIAREIAQSITFQ